MKLRILMVMLAFIAGILTSTLITGANDFNQVYTDGFEFPNSFADFLGSAPVLEMPTDRIHENQILVTKDEVKLNIKNAEWSTFTPTKSMVPFLDSGANAIQVKPEEGCFDVQVGDIISYESEFTDGVIIHRVVGSGVDDEGLFFIAKGDSNPKEDPGKIRCSQILRVLVAIIY